MKSKKLLAMLLCGTMTLTGLLAGCGNNEEDSKKDSVESEKEEDSQKEDSKEEADSAKETNPYEEKVEFSATTYYSLFNSTHPGDYKEDEYYQYMCDKFNIDMDIWITEYPGSTETQRTWITTGSMPDHLWWHGFTTGEYASYVEQGLLKPLPEDWEERWPNLAKAAKKSGIYDLLYDENGLAYAIPHAAVGNYYDVEQRVHHQSLYLRKDWADEIGMPELYDDYKITLAEVKEYATKVKEAGLCDNSFWGGYATGFVKMWYGAYGLAYPEVEFILDENGYSWLGNQEGTTEMIQEMQNWYNDGYVHPEIGTMLYSEYMSMFGSGLLPVLNTDGNMATVQQLAGMLKETYPDQDPYELFFGATITTEDGTPYESGVFNYWGVTVFSPETSDEKLERILDVMEYTATKEGQAERQLGYYGTDWEMDEAGNINIINEGVTKDDFGIFNTMVWTTDDFEFSGFDPTKDPEAAEMVLGFHEAKASGVISFTGAEYAAHNSDIKNNYPASLVREGILQIAFNNKEVESSWAQFIEDNRNLWEPLENELNETYGY